MFVDYYALLEINETATPDEIKKAFRTQAIKWHPDKNPGRDTTDMMQLLNEANLILKDTSARERYDIEYQRFKAYKRQKTEEPKQESEKAHQEPGTSRQEPEADFQSEGFDIDDEILKRWINNARRQAVELARQTIKDFKGITAAGAKGATEGCFNQFLAQIFIAILFLLIFGLAKGCGS